MDAARTVGEAIRQARRQLQAVSESPGTDAQVLLADCLGTSRTWILSHPESPLAPQQARSFADRVACCESGTPLPYVLGWWEFYGRRFHLAPEVLIPRPETELLVEASLEYLRGNPQRRLVADVGTGSGCIAVTLAAEVPEVFVVATDRSLPALRIAHSNARAHGVHGRVALLRADLGAPLTGGLDLICANLPYVPSGELASLRVAEAEPWTSLDGGEDGLVLIRRLLAALPAGLRAGGRAVLEVGAGQAARVADWATRTIPGVTPVMRTDLAGHERVVILDRAEAGA